MNKLQSKISGCMCSMAGAGEFCALRSHLATAARHDVSAFEALTSAFRETPGSLKPDRRYRHKTPASPSQNRGEPI